MIYEKIYNMFYTFYKFLVRYYLASISDDAKGEELFVFISLSSEKFFVKVKHF